jgi:hypothetical protein
MGIIVAETATVATITVMSFANTWQAAIKNGGLELFIGEFELPTTATKVVEIGKSIKSDLMAGLYRLGFGVTPRGVVAIWGCPAGVTVLRFVEFISGCYELTLNVFGPRG